MIDSFSKIYAGREIKRGLALQAVDLDSGEVVIYDETMPSDFLGTAVAASASLPAIFSPVYHD
jgi:predicted acylesterase/phospholipase RssA